MVKVEITLTGITAMLHDMVTPEQLEQIRTKTSPPKNLDESQQDEAARKVYQQNGHFGVPIENLFACLIDAGRFVKNGRTNISTRFDTTLPALLDLRGDFYPFKNGVDWTVDIRPGRNKKGELMVLVRPKFNEWEFDLTVEIDDKEVNLDTIKSLFNKAGSRVGLGGFRPAKKGRFGRFIVSKWEAKS